MYKLVSTVFMNSHIDFSEKDAAEVVKYSMDTANIVPLDPNHDRRVNMFYM